MKADEIWARLDEMKGQYERWAIVARKLGMNRQDLFYCLKHRAVTDKLLKAMDLEVSYVRAK